MRIYRQPHYGYWVFAVGEFSLRIGRGRSDRHIAVMWSTPQRRPFSSSYLLALWFRLGRRCLFVQFDYGVNDGGTS